MLLIGSRLERRARIGFGVALILLSGEVGAQRADVPAVSMGHLHYQVRDVDANRRFWMALGGQPITMNGTDVVKFPGLLVFLTKGAADAGTDGSVVNHVAFRVTSLAAIEAKGLKVERTPQFVGIGSVFTPEGERIELFDETATNLGFTLDEGSPDARVQRHNRPLSGAIAFHHIHLYLPDGADTTAKAWYARTFGALPGKRWRYEAADLPGVNMNFSAAQTPAVPLKGRRLDHIGFEVKDLEAFCKRLQAQGIAFDVPYTRQPSGLATASITDPWGTAIELTEGLGEL